MKAFSSIEITATITIKHTQNSMTLLQSVSVEEYSQDQDMSSSMAAVDLTSTEPIVIMTAKTIHNKETLSTSLSSTVLYSSTDGVVPMVTDTTLDMVVLLASSVSLVAVIVVMVTTLSVVLLTVRWRRKRRRKR